MAFRDDRDALLARNRVLEEENRELREQAQRATDELTRLRQQFEKDQEELDELRKQLPGTMENAIERQRQSNRRERVVTVLLMVMMAGIVAAGILVFKRFSASPSDEPDAMVDDPVPGSATTPTPLPR